MPPSLDISSEKSIICGDLVYVYQNTLPDLSGLDLSGLDVTGFDVVSYYSRLQQNLDLYRDYINNLRSFNFSSAALYGFSFNLQPLPQDVFNIPIFASSSACKRATRRLRDLIYSNLPSRCTSARFVTLTYAIPQFSLSQVKADFNLFIKRLRYHLSLDFRYIAVPEKHKSGAYHIHYIIFDTGFIPSDQLSNIWSKGFVRINLISGDTSKIANYLAKYLTKDYLLSGTRRFMTSHNINRPYEVADLSTLPPLREITSYAYTTFSGEKIHLTINRIF